MTPERVYERFCQEFPGMVPKVVKWFHRNDSAADYSIRIMLKNHRSLIFNINKDGTWELVSQ